jgi:putative endonuclease
MASKRNGTLYTGMTNNLVRRVYEHRNHLAKGFTTDYDIKNLVWFEIADNPQSAIVREKQIKGWKRNWKLELIEENNPGWKDLYNEISS